MSPKTEDLPLRAGFSFSERISAARSIRAGRIAEGKVWVLPGNFGCCTFQMSVFDQSQGFLSFDGNRRFAFGKIFQEFD